MQCYTEVLPPSGVTHAVSAAFTSATANNLVVIKTSLLQIYNLVTETVTPSVLENGQRANDNEKRNETTKLQLFAEYDLHGTVTDISRINILNSRSGGDALLLSFRNAKLSLIEWNPEIQNISTVSIHYYEKEDITLSPWAPDLSQCDSHLTVDPSSRCAVLNFGVRNLAILPFHQAGDDLVMDEYDPDLDMDDFTGQDKNTSHTDSKKGTEKDHTHQTPYAASFVLPLTALDPTLIHPIGLTFLHEYREPTFGILYSPIATSAALLEERKDVVVYSVFTLDLEQRASTPLLSIAKLPSDLLHIMALPAPVGGALLIGSNELIHVDQSGKASAVAVNEFAKQVSSFPMIDQSDLGLRLENSVVEVINKECGDILLTLSTGELVLVHFKIDGRSVSGPVVCPVPTNSGGDVVGATASCSISLGSGKVFIGSEDTDSLLLDCYVSSAVSKKSKDHGEDQFDEDMNDEDDDDMYEDDLYSSAPKEAVNKAVSNGSASEDYSFRVLDKLPSLASLRSVTVGKPASRDSDAGNVSQSVHELELAAAYGSGRNGGVALLQRALHLDGISTMNGETADSVWNINTSTKSGRNDPSEGESPSYVFLTKSNSTDNEETLVYAVNGSNLEPFSAPDVNPNGDPTVDIGTLAGNSRVVQVLTGEVRVYDTNLGMAQIYPVWDEDEGDERFAVSTSFADPYLLIIRDDSSVLLLHSDESGDLDELSKPETISSQSWLCGCLYTDKHNVFEDNATGNTYMFLLNQECKLFMFRLPTRELVSVTEGVDYVSSILSSDQPAKRLNSRETIAELLVADLGEISTASPYLIIRSATDDLIIYKPVRENSKDEKTGVTLKYIKESNHFLPKVPIEAAATDTQQRMPGLRRLADIGGYAAVLMSGASPSLVVRTSKSLPRVFSIQSDSIRGISGFDSAGCEKGLIYVDNEHVVRTCRLHDNTQLDFSWPIRKIPLNEEVDYLAYSTVSGTYVVGTTHEQDFKLPDNDELHPEWANEDISLRPKVAQGSIKLLNPKTWKVIDSYTFNAAERITAIENINLEISEKTSERKDMIVVGTTFAKGEDIAARGNVYVFDVINVVPDPDEPGTNLKLKLIGEESVRGALTAVSGIGGQGFLIVAQGQKCMVRGLKDDGSLLPVAFIDVQCYVSVIKELKGTGMCLIGDALKGLWFTGYSEEPYKMTLFGKDLDELEVVTADFLPDGKKLYILVADSDCNLHVLQYDPEDPKSSNGDRLLNRCKFHMGHFASTITLLPRTAVSSELAVMNSDSMDIDSYIPLHQALITTQSGLMALVTSLSEESYRRLSALQSQLSNTLEHPCGLNPRAYRAVESDGVVGRGMIDGKLLMRWLDLSRPRKLEIAGRVGADEWEIRADLEAVSGAGLGYL
ncbi:cleavage and polyadenylation specificity factor subunit A, putative [Talaromyces stipitatus ATCC 10500]|uniref:Protein CFT1 n=1 Tax=Talaromyces stipitatus (strain ATCC 10500 / CBS 375.48 / QM 6759 / NRRL 1006) TaxID=441959 RepID=B8MHN4_TALSN|nr:cleavage and polyadenylation specificity factor subunit A, putative [Talaromyces stipitatus ATCC 10500]EED16015.1 cleavage and polyadenylation specificity factor subunit A, putative [Talaromyces stipitatus ATCC 10500]